MYFSVRTDQKITSLKHHNHCLVNHSEVPGKVDFEIDLPTSQAAKAELEIKNLLFRPAMK